MVIFFYSSYFKENIFTQAVIGNEVENLVKVVKMTLIVRKYYYQERPKRWPTL